MKKIIIILAILSLGLISFTTKKVCKSSIEINIGESFHL